MLAVSFVRRLLELLKRKAGPGLGGAIGAGSDDRRGGGVEIVRAAGGGLLRLVRKRRLELAQKDQGRPLARRPRLPGGDGRTIDAAMLRELQLRPTERAPQGDHVDCFFRL